MKFVKIDQIEYTMEEFLKQYHLAKEGDKKAISFMLSQMEEGNLLQKNPLTEIKWRIQLSEQSEDNICTDCFDIKAFKDLDKPIYFEPEYVRKENEEKEVLADIMTWKKNLQVKREAEEKAKKEAEEKAKREAEERAKQEAEERAKKEAEEKALEEAKAAEEEERKLVDYLRDTKQQTLFSIIKDMVYVEGGSFLMGNPSDSSNPPHIVEVKPFWIKKNDISHSEMSDLQFKFNYDKAVPFCNRLSSIIGVEFQLPSQEQLEYAVKSGYCRLASHSGNLVSNRHGCICIDSNLIYRGLLGLVACFRIICLSPKFHSIQETYKKREEEENWKKEEEKKKNAEEARLRAEQERIEQERKRREKEERLRSLWHSIVDEYLNNTDSYIYHKGFLFTKKTFSFRYIKAPLTWRIWNAITKKNSLEEWESKDTKALQEEKRDIHIPHPYKEDCKYNLDKFLDKLNEYTAGKMKLDFIFYNRELEDNLVKEGKIGKGVYLYIKED